jgi:hypothetical protein
MSKEGGKGMQLVHMSIILFEFHSLKEIELIILLLYFISPLPFVPSKIPYKIYFGTMN